ncbi:MAG: hypothetical protein PHU21_05000, partial [Elusimicrobia bacterium]|nr:hypothetical protein [Elusimicrobiota bacterium]
MNPKSRMVIFAILALAAPALLPSPSRAIVIGGQQYYWDKTTAAQNTVTPMPVPGNAAWMMMQSKSDGKYYYAQKSKVAALAEDQSCELYAKVGADTPVDNARLYRFKTENLRTRKYELNYVLVFDQKMKLSLDAKGLRPVTLDLKSPLVAPKSQASAPAEPRFTAALQMIKERNAEAYKALAGKGDAAMQSLMAAMKAEADSYDKAHPGKPLDAKGVYAAMTRSAQGQKSRLDALLDEAAPAAAQKALTPPASQKGKGVDEGKSEAEVEGKDTN